MFSAVRRALYPRSDTDGFKKLPWTTVNLCTSSPRMYDFIKDERGMNMMYGKGWSAAFMSLASPTPPSSQEPRSGSTYVALTIPSPVVQARESLERLEGEYIEALLVDPGLEDARAYPLYTSKRTIIGRDRALLIGDASHGMVPFCGAGASAGIRDAVDLAAFLNSGERSLILYQKGQPS